MPEIRCRQLAVFILKTEVTKDIFTKWSFAQVCKAVLIKKVLSLFQVLFFFQLQLHYSEPLFRYKVELNVIVLILLLTVVLKKFLY